MPKGPLGKRSEEGWCNILRRCPEGARAKRERRLLASPIYARSAYCTFRCWRTTCLPLRGTRLFAPLGPLWAYIAAGGATTKRAPKGASRFIDLKAVQGPLWGNPCFARRDEGAQRAFVSLRPPKGERDEKRRPRLSDKKVGIYC